MSDCKPVMGYGKLVSICADIVKECERRNFDPDLLVAVMRGGMTASHILAKMMKKKVAVFFPSAGDYCPAHLNWPCPIDYIDTKFLFVEDLIAQGRTFEEVRKFMDNAQYGCSEWLFAPTLIDGSYEVKSDKIIETYRCDEWIVFPYEDAKDVVSGDRGLFRNGTDKYGK